MTRWLRFESTILPSLGLDSNWLTHCFPQWHPRSILIPRLDASLLGHSLRWLVWLWVCQCCLEVDDWNSTHFQEIRLDAVHLRGLDDMSTDDIFKFFADHYPSHIEWIDDTSCNVVWKDETSAAGAILEMSRPNRSKSTEEKTQVLVLNTGTELWPLNSGLLWILGLWQLLQGYFSLHSPLPAGIRPDLFLSACCLCLLNDFCAFF